MAEPILDPIQLRDAFPDAARLACLHIITGPDEMDHLKDEQGAAEQPLCELDVSNGVWAWRMDIRGQAAVRRASCPMCKKAGSAIMIAAGEDMRELRAQRAGLEVALRGYADLMN